MIPKAASASPDPEVRLRENQERYTRHSLDQLAFLRELRMKGTLNASSALFLATQLVNHGFPDAATLIADLRAGARNPSVLEFLDELAARHRAIMALAHRGELFRSEALMNRLYQTEGATLVRHPGGSRDLMVVFDTLYNHFGVSNPVLVALLQQCGYGVLLLRDTTNRRFLGGVPGCGQGFDGLADHITTLAKTEGFDRIFLTGYSSGGYAAVLMSTLIEVRACHVFGAESDFSSGGPPAAIARTAVDLRAEVDVRHLLALRERVAAAAGSTARHFCYGERNAFDRAQAEPFRGLPGCRVEEVKGCGHQVVVKLLETGRLLPLLASARAA